MLRLSRRDEKTMGVLAVATASALGCAGYIALAVHRASDATDEAERVDMFWSLGAIALHVSAAILLASLVGMWTSGALGVEHLLADSARTRDRKIVLIAWLAFGFHATWVTHAVGRTVLDRKARQG